MHHSLQVLALATLVPCSRAVGQTTAATSPPPVADVAARAARNLHIVERAAALMNTPAAWNQADKKSCHSAPQSYTIYCALTQAAKDVPGPDDGGAVLDVARDVIDFVSARDYSARLVDYNNDSTTTFTDARAVLDIVRNRIQRQLDSANGAATPTGPSTCRLVAAAQRWRGTCGHIFDETPVFVITHASAITSGVWRKDVQPSIVWAGTMTDSAGASDDVELEVYAGATGIMRTPFGWFPVSNFSSTDSVVQFQVDGVNEVPPSALDRDILQRAAAILTSDAVWNRADNRECPPTATTWSIYCAMEKATIEVTGGFHHRRPAMELVRVIIEDRTKGKSYDHRLMGYNNDPATHLADVQSVFAEALSRVH